MSKEIDDLLEINSEQDTLETAIKPRNFIPYFSIHLGILVVLIGLPYYLIEISNGSNDELLIAIVFAVLFLVFLVVLIVETIYYQVTKKFQLRNSALVTILISILSMMGLLVFLGL
ncbi:hypothetical protein [Flavobacterium sp.]|uniref:hypothetical protein n=1 Tax=Flavobacterium sp. TaxID=239 RepID=UPI00286E2CF7|nr:hypothetical protein [Flavobacterium sp.]